MDTRKKLVGILKAASLAVGQNSEMSKDLNTMSLALASVSPDKFASMVDSSVVEELVRYAADCVEDDSETPQHEAAKKPDEEMGAEASKANEEDASSEASWNTKAAAAIRAKLAREILGFDVTRPDEVKGATLTKDQTPDGTHNKGTLTGLPEEVAGAKLTPEQTPQDDKTLKTDMVAESHGAVNTMQGKAKEALDTTTPDPKDQIPPTPEPEENEAEASYHFAGVEMSERSNVQAAQVDEKEAAELKDLFT
jgi:hypothetical protein